MSHYKNLLPYLFMCQPCAEQGGYKANAKSQCYSVENLFLCIWIFLSRCIEQVTDRKPYG